MILVYRSSFGTSNRGCAASQRVAGPYEINIRCDCNLTPLKRDTFVKVNAL